MVSFSTTGLLLHVALFRLGTTHDCAIGQAGPSIWSRLPPALLTEVPMRRIGLAVVLALSVVLTSLAAEAQQGVRVQGQRVPRIGVACNNCVSHPKPDDPLAAFLQELSRLGYEIGKNVVVDIRGTTGDRFPDIIAELVRAPVDVLVVSPTAAALAAKAANLS